MSQSFTGANRKPFPRFKKVIPDHYKDRDNDWEEYRKYIEFRLFLFFEGIIFLVTIGGLIKRYILK